MSELKISKETADFIAGNEGRIKIAADGSNTVDNAIFTDQLKAANIDPEVAKAVLHQITVLTAGSTKLVAEEAIAAAEANEDLKQVKVKIPLVDRSYVSVLWNRDDVVRNVREGTSREVNGTVSSKISLAATRNSGDYGRIREHMRDLATQRLAKSK